MAYCMYLRKSRADMEAEAHGEGETLARHQAMLAELAKRQKLTVVKIYKEIVSGESIAARPQMQALLADITDGKYDGVLVVEIERLARGNTIDQGVVAQAFKESNTKIVTPSKTYDPQNEFDEEYFEFSLFMSRREYKTIRRRMNAGRISSVKEGNYICSRTPYGYRKVSPDHKVHTLEIVPEEAEVIRMIYDLYLSGKGAKAIAGTLNQMGIKPQKSEYWENPSIKKILANPLYCGKVSWNPRNSPAILCQGLHEAIIPEDVFAAAQEKRKTNPAASIHPNDTLLNYYHNVLYCKNCGHQLKRRFIKGSGQAHLLCVYRQCRGMIVSSTMRSVDEAVMSAFRYHMHELSGMLENGSQNPPEIKPDMRKPLIAELERSTKQQSKLCDFLEQGIYNADTYITRSKLLTSRIEELKRQIQEIDAAGSRHKKAPQDAIADLQYVVDNLEAAEPEEKNRMLKKVCSRIYYSKTTRMCLNNRNSDLAVEVDFL